MNIFENWHYIQTFNIQTKSQIKLKSLSNTLVKSVKTYENPSNEIRKITRRIKTKVTLMVKVTIQTIPVCDKYDFLAQIQI